MDVKRLVERLTREARITVLTGAGVSAASGVPTFRGADGLWKNFRPETLATAEAFGRDPKLVWEWYAWRRSRIAACDPNAAHRVLADWSRRFPNFRLITQNVDGLHESAGTENTIRLHGSIWEVSCWQGCAKAPKRWRDETLSFAEMPPRCPHCGGPIRPGVVWFGETLDPAVVRQASQGRRVRRLHHHRHVGGRLSGGRIHRRGEAAWRVYRRDQPGGDTGDRAPSIWRWRPAPSASCPRSTALLPRRIIRL